MQAPRLSPLFLGRGLVAKNRLVVPPMASETAAADGLATAKTLAHYARLSEAGAGITFVEYTYVHASGRSEPNQLGLTSPEHMRAVAEIARIIKDAGSIPGIQLTHAGGKTERDMTGGVLMGPSNVPVPAKDRELEAPTPMSLAEIALWQESFLRAADYAVFAGFPLIELHAAHGYGLGQWLSPLTNLRTDGYGGGARSRLIVEIIEQIRARHPQLLIAVRMPGRDFLDGGLSSEDALALARSLIAAGVDLIDVSSGLGGWRRPADRQGEGYLLPEAAFLQKNLGVPVIGVGGIQTGAFIDQALSRGELSLAAVGRAILAGPALFRQEQLCGQG